MRGRPIGFLAMIAFGWIGSRTIVLWTVPPVIAATQIVGEALPKLAEIAGLPVTMPDQTVALAPGRRVTAGMVGATGLNDAQIVALYGLHYFVEVNQPAADSLLATPALAAPPIAPNDAAGGAVASASPGPLRWQLSGWLIVRPGSADPRRTALLGGSQAGLRASYALDEDRRLALFVRAATALPSGGGEVAAGGQWRPTKAPVTAFAEMRYREKAGAAPAVGVFGGGIVGLPAEFRLETYGQAGWVGGRGATGFAEGQARAARVVERNVGATVDIGGGIWGAAQRGAARLDLGPSANVVLPLGRRAIRLGLDWRQRIAGHAAPGSGPALSAGADF